MLEKNCYSNAKLGCSTIDAIEINQNVLKMLAKASILIPKTSKFLSDSSLYEYSSADVI